MDELTRDSFLLKQLTHLNACRLYLNIIHLSDMTYPDGKINNHNYLVGVKPIYPTSKLKWQTQNIYFC